MAAELERRPGTTAADWDRVQAEFAAVRDRLSRHGTIPLGIGPMRKSMIVRDPGYIAAKKDFDAHFYYKHTTSFSDVAFDVFAGAVAITITAGAASAVVGAAGSAGAAAAPAAEGGGFSLSGIGSSISSAATTVGGVAAKVGTAGGALAGLVKKLAGGHSNELSPVSGAHSGTDLVAAPAPLTSDMNSMLPIAIVALVAIMVVGVRK